MPIPNGRLAAGLADDSGDVMDGTLCGGLRDSRLHPVFGSDCVRTAGSAASFGTPSVSNRDTGSECLNVTVNASTGGLDCATDDGE